MFKRFLSFILIALIAFAPVSASAIKYKGDLEANESVTLPEQGSTPANPSATKHKLYIKSDGNAYTLNSAGTESSVGIADSEISEAEGFLRKTGAGAYEAVKSNLTATTDPTVNEDSGDGYAVGSVWINVTLDKVFQASDVTVAGAVWRDLSAAAAGGITLGTEQASTSGSNIDFTGIPAGVKRITLMFVGVSLNGGDRLLVQLGDSGGFETTGYVSTSWDSSTAVDSSTAGFIMRNITAGDTFSGHMTLTRLNTSPLWASSHVGKRGTTTAYYGGGDKTLSGELTQIRIGQTGGSTFDAGIINIMYQ